MAHGLSVMVVQAQGGRAALPMSEATVKTHIGHILSKLDLRDRVHAVIVAYECGLVTPS